MTRRRVSGCHADSDRRAYLRKEARVCFDAKERALQEAEQARNELDVEKERMDVDIDGFPDIAGKYQDQIKQEIQANAKLRENANDQIGRLRSECAEAELKCEDIYKQATDDIAAQRGTITKQDEELTQKYIEELKAQLSSELALQKANYEQALQAERERSEGLLKALADVENKELDFRATVGLMKEQARKEFEHQKIQFERDLSNSVQQARIEEKERAVQNSMSQIEQLKTQHEKQNGLLNGAIRQYCVDIQRLELETHRLREVACPNCYPHRRG